MRGKQRRSRLRKGSPIMKKLIASSCAHFCVDLCCAALFFGYLNASPQWWLCMVLYNTCAFALQLPLGLIADARNRNLPFAAFGCALICISFFLKGISVVAALISGLGRFISSYRKIHAEQPIDGIIIFNYKDAVHNLVLHCSVSINIIESEV